MTWGANPWAICDRCGRKFRHKELRKEWTGLMVCAVGPQSCWDPRPAHLDPPRIDPAEGAPIKNPRPRPDPVFVEDASLVTDPEAWTQPAPTPREPIVWITDDDPVTPEDL